MGMFFELVGTVVAGVAAALLVWAVGRYFANGLPKWLMPVAAGGAMLVAAISSEYGWYGRTTQVMPEGFVVAATVEEKAIWRPWTYVRPFVSRFIAVDTASIKTHAAHPDQRIADLFFYGRWQRTARLPMLFDCAGLRSADIADGIEFAQDGSVIGAKWRSAENDDVLKTACAEV